MFATVSSLNTAGASEEGPGVNEDDDVAADVLALSPVLAVVDIMPTRRSTFSRSAGRCERGGEWGFERYINRQKVKKQY